MVQYWFISIPCLGNKQHAFQNLKGEVASHRNDLAELDQFPVPEFKIGTLDALVLLSDELAKFDALAEQSTLKVVDVLRTLLKNEDPNLQNYLNVDGKSVDQYIKNFQWNSMKYRTDKSLQEMSTTLNQEVSSIDNLIKRKLIEYNQVKGNLQALQRKETGNLSIRNLTGVVKKEDFVLNSEYLETLLIAVPINAQKDWLNTYETLTQMVVPRSSQKLAEDDEYALYNVTLFQRVADEFTHKCREEKFIVRDFKYSEEALSKQQHDMEVVEAEEKELWSSLLRLAKTNFGEVFSAWIHIKALRVCVESILRYGLPPDFVSMVLKPKSKKSGHLSGTLNRLYGALGGSHGQIVNTKSSNSSNADEEGEFSHLFDKEYRPFVFFELIWTVSEK